MNRAAWSSLLFFLAFITSSLVVLTAMDHLVARTVSWLAVIAVSLAYCSTWIITDNWLAKKNPLMSRRLSVLVFASSLFPLLTTLPYIWYRSSSDGVTEVAYLSTAAMVVSELILGIMLFCILLAWAASIKKPWFVASIEEHPFLFLGITAVCWTVAASILNILINRYMHVWGPNTELAVQAMNNLLDDRGPLYSSVLQASGSSLLGVHANLIFFLVYPLFRIAPRYETVLILGQVSLAATVFPLFLLARSRLSQSVSLLVCLIFLAHPTIASAAGIQDMSELRFLPLPLITSLLFYERRNFTLFALFAILAMSVREDVALLYALLGIYSLFIRRSWMWWLIPTMAGLGWFVFATRYFIPAFNPSGEFTRLQVVYEEYGGTQQGLIWHFISQPWTLFQRIFSNFSNIGLLYGLFLTTGMGAPLLSGLVSLAAPGLAENILITRTSISSHHIIMAVVPLIAALIYGLARLDSWISRRYEIKAGTASTLVALLTLFSCLSSFHVWYSPERFIPRYNYDSARAVLELLPSDATVVLPTYMMVHTSDGQVPVGYYQISYRTDAELDVLQEKFIVIDDFVPGELEETRLFEGRTDLIEALDQNDDYRLIFDSDDLKLYERED